MNYRNKEVVDCFAGVLNILTEDRVVFQGQLVREHPGDRKVYQSLQTNGITGNNFLVLELRCEPAIIRDNAQLQTINPPLFQQGDIVRIRRSEIIAIGPGTGCIEETDSAD